MRTEQIVCDACGRDLTSTGNCKDFRLLVTSERIPSMGGMVTLMHIYPPVDRAYHFCGLRCLNASELVDGGAA